MEGAFADHPDIASANVFAINMTEYGYDGQLGCAAITAHREKIDRAEEEAFMRDLESYLTVEGGLPSYAVPRFVRILREAEVATDANASASDSMRSERVNTIFKKIKMGLRKEGFSPPPESRDRMYWLRREGYGFEYLNRETQRQLLGGRAKL